MRTEARQEQSALQGRGALRGLAQIKPGFSPRMGGTTQALDGDGGGGEEEEEETMVARRGICHWMTPSIIIIRARSVACVD